MDKKELKWYVAPAQEIVDLKLEGMLCTSDPDDVKGREDDPEFED